MICTGNDVISFYLILLYIKYSKLSTNSVSKFCLLLTLLMQNYDINLLLNLLQFFKSIIVINRVIS